MRSERVRGASWYLREALRILAESSDPEAAARELRSIRPGMAPLDLIALVVEEAARRGAELRPIVERFLAYSERAQAGLRAAVSGLGLRCPADFITISFSRAVGDFIATRRSCVKRLYLLESRPGDEAAAALEEYGKYVEVAPIPDSAAGAVRFDYVVIGLDGLYADGRAFNKVGTLPLLAVARTLGAVSIAVFESYKAAPVASPEPYRVEAEALGRRIAVPLFDRFDSSLIDLAVTDLGVFERPSGEFARRAWSVIAAALGLT